MSAYRSSDPALAYGDLPPGPQRWDRERFDRYSRGGYDDRDYHRPPPRRESRFVEADVVERSGPRRFEERERFVEEDRYAGPPRRRTEFLDEPIPAEVANRALAPYRRKSIVEREVDIETLRRPRPQIIRRQSSLDTFDRRPLPRYGDEYYIPADVPLRVRRPEPPRDRVREREFEEIRYRDLEPDAYDEYEDIRIRRERSRGPRRVSVSASRASKSVRSASSSSSSFEEVEAVEEKKEILIGKRGKTRMPKRLAHRQVIIDLGLTFEEEDDFFIIQRALEKEHIDEIIEKSKVYRAEREKTVYKYEEKIEAPVPPPPPMIPMIPVIPVEEKEQVITKRTEIFEGGSRSRHASPARSVSSHHHHHHHGGGVVEEFEESATVAGPLTVLAHEGRSDRDMRRELAALEAERRTLRLERDVDDRRALALTVRDRDGYEVVDRREIVEERPVREIIRVEKDRKGRMALVRSAR